MLDIFFFFRYGMNTVNAINTMKYILYARKSTEQEERQAMSIESQENEMVRLAEKSGIRIEKTYKESMSAKQTGRPIFNEMLDSLGKNKDCVVFAWKPDRLSRNIIDGGKLVELLERGNIKEIRTIDKVITDNPTDKFMLLLDFGVGKKYSDDLSVNVKRGNRAKLEKGGWPGIAPLGYLNDKLNKTIVVDEERALYIKKAFELYAMGGKSVMEVANVLYERGFRSRTGQKIHKSKIHTILSDPFYSGMMKRNDVVYQGKHEPIVSHELFEKVQDVLFRRIHTKMQTLFFPLRGYIKCGSCGCAFTASRKKGHDYYYCTNGKGQCEEHKRYMRSEKMETLISTVFDEISFDEELIELAYLAQKERGKHDETYKEASRETIVKKLEFVSRKESRLLESYLSELIPQDVYEAKTKELHNEKETLNAQLQKSDQMFGNGLCTLEHLKNVFLTANRTKSEFLNAPNEKKAKVLETVLWNLEIRNGEMASVRYKMPYEILKKSPKNGDFSTMLGC